MPPRPDAQLSAPYTDHRRAGQEENADGIPSFEQPHGKSARPGAANSGLAPPSAHGHNLEKPPVQEFAMIGRLNHVAIAVPDLEAAAAGYRDMLGAKVGAPQDEPDHGVTVVFIELPNTKIELLCPLGEKSPIKNFLEKSPAGGIHHMCYEVGDILAARDRLIAAGARVLGNGEPRTGAHGKPVLFLHPKDFNGCLIELEEA